jgi:NADH-quinone oxidoreductase subunit H
MAKVSFFLFLFIWIRWTIPRFRYDQLMNLGWKKLIPLALINMLISAALLLFLNK